MSPIPMMSRNETKAILSSASGTSAAVTPIMKAARLKPQLVQSSTQAVLSPANEEDKTPKQQRRELLERKSKALIASSSVQSLSLEND